MFEEKSSFVFLNEKLFFVFLMKNHSRSLKGKSISEKLIEGQQIDLIKHKKLIFDCFTLKIIETTWKTMVFTYTSEK